MDLPKDPQQRFKDSARRRKDKLLFGRMIKKRVQIPRSVCGLNPVR
jgi:hypothetical protein